MEQTIATAQSFLGRLDFLVIGIYLAATIIIGVSFAKQGAKDIRSFFIGNSSIPWWMVGISLLAACFAADTPLWIGDVIYKRGVEGAWYFWANGIGVAFYILAIAPLWRRTGVVTDPEFFELRYSGNGATFLRGFNSIWSSLFVNIIMMTVSTLSITKILQASIDFGDMSPNTAKLLCVVITMGTGFIYCAISGIWGCSASDLLQFFVTFVGSLILAGFTIFKAGGINAIVGKIGQTDWVGHNLNIFPDLSDPLGLPIYTVVFLFCLKWIEQTGMGGYVAQKLFAAKSPKESVWTAMVWGAMYFSFIPFPWIITIVCSKFMIPGLADGQQAYPKMAMQILPLGLKGVLIASLIAAFMSTYATLLNWGSSYFVNDFYKRFLVKNASQKHYIRIARLIMIPMAIAAGYFAFTSDSIFQKLQIPLAFGAGGTTLLLARWLWWRPNQWSEISSTIGSLAITAFLCFSEPIFGINLSPLASDPDIIEKYFGVRMLIILLGTLVIWVTVTLLTEPVNEEKLNYFYKKVRPPLFWGPIRKRLGMKSEISFKGVMYGWLMMVVAIFCPLVGLLKIVFGHPILGLFLVVVGFAGLTLAIKRANLLYNEPVKAAEQK